MHKTIELLPEIYLVGMSARTNNAAEMNPETAKIGTTMQRFFGSGVQEKIPFRKNPGRIFAVYTNYESDFKGDYTYFIGEEVTSFSPPSEDLEQITIPGQQYTKFTSLPGVMPQVVINMWRDIWAMSPANLGGARAYIADFEIYDERSHNPEQAIVDVYIGIKE